MINDVFPQLCTLIWIKVFSSAFRLSNVNLSKWAEMHTWTGLKWFVVMKAFERQCMLGCLLIVGWTQVARVWYASFSCLCSSRAETLHVVVGISRWSLKAIGVLFRNAVIWLKRCWLCEYKMVNTTRARKNTAVFSVFLPRLRPAFAKASGC